MSNQILSTLKTLVEIAIDAGADHAAAIGNASRTSAIRFAQNQVTQNQENRKLAVTCSLSQNQKEIVFETNSTDPKKLEQMVKLNLESIKLAPQNPEFVPPVSPDVYPKTTTWYESTAKVNDLDRAAVVRSICQTAHGQKVDVYGNLSVDEGELNVVNSSGIELSQAITNTELHITARTRDGNGSGQAAASDNDWGKFRPMDTACKAMDTALNSKNPKTIAPGKYTVILTPEAVLEYAIFMLFSMDAREAEMGRSFFAKTEKGKTKIGEKLFDESITVESRFDHPDLPSLSFGTSFGSGGSETGIIFNFGMPMQNQTWIDKGVLKTLRNSPYWALKNNQPRIASPMNCIISGSQTPLSELIKSTEKGVLISTFWYTRFTDPTQMMQTGLTRDGTFLIEKGEITSPLVNFRYNDSPVRSFNHIAQIGTQHKVTTKTVTGMIPYLKIDDFNLSSVSDAF